MATKSVGKALGLTTLLLLLIGLGHWAVLQSTGVALEPIDLIGPYLLNWSITLLAIASLRWAIVRNMSFKSFGFLLGSGLKFILFLFLFYPAYKADGVLSRVETTSFVIPYISCLFIETLVFVRFLNKLDD